MASFLANFIVLLKMTKRNFLIKNMKKNVDYVPKGCGCSLKEQKEEIDKRAEEPV